MVLQEAKESFASPDYLFTRDLSTSRMSNSECDFMLERFELRRTGLKHKKINKKYFYSDFIFCEKACYACYRGGDLSKKGPLRFELVLRGKRINRKKLNVKTLSRPRIKRTYQSSNSNMCHLDMAAGQRHGVKLSNSKIANYNSSTIVKEYNWLDVLNAF